MTTRTYILEHWLVKFMYSPLNFRYFYKTINNIKNSYNHCFEYRALESLINFAYSGRISINVNNVQSLLIGASFLQLKWVRNACATFIKER